MTKDFPDTASRAEFMLKLLQELKIHKPVVVAPSMSGYYLLPFIMRHVEHVRIRLGALASVCPPVGSPIKCRLLTSDRFLTFRDGIRSA